MVCSINALRQLEVLSDEDNNGRWICLNDFLTFLRQNHRPTDVIKEIKRCNVFKELKGHSGGLKEINGQLVAPVKSILRYIFHHCEQLFICQKVVEQIENRCYDKSLPSLDISIKDIYNSVVKAEYRKLEIENYLLQNLSFDSHIETLYTDYKNDYSEDQWKKICLFEHHFSKSLFYIQTESYENIIHQRRKFLESLRNCYELQSSFIKCAKDAIIERTKRRELDEANQAVSIIARKRHSPQILEAQLSDAFQENSKLLKLICVDCTSFCQHQKAVHVYVEVEEVIHFPDYILLITSYILNKHEEKCAEVVFLSKGTLDMYTDKYEKPTRFEFRDDLLLKKINKGIIHVWNCDDEDVLDEVDTITNCQTCYGDVIAKPLNMKSFDTVTEWTLNVPILSQLFLESFINRKSVRRSENLDQFILSKLKKLYGHYDSLLNLLNKNYIGLLQDINSQELAMNYHSINTVFSVTSASGATLSLNEAEQRMKEKANSDYCYYNTYLKKHEVMYETVSGVKKEQINIRNCILVLMMDNLVRLKYHKDPEPGESRSMQICTLPITIKGMPKDAVVVDSWHDHQICDGTDACLCKVDRELTKEDFKQKVLHLNKAETDVKMRFQHLMNWGFASVLREAFDNGVWNTLKLAEGACHQEHTLETSFASLKMDDDDQELDNLRQNSRTVEDYEANERRDNEYIDDSKTTNTMTVELYGEERGEESFEMIFDNTTVNTDELDTDVNLSTEHQLHSTDKLNMSLDDSFNFTSLSYEDGENVGIEGVISALNFSMYRPPPLLTRHPPPATGKDDDISKLKEILDDVLIKTDHFNLKQQHEKILFGPDNKIGNNLLKLREGNRKYQHFLPEFPLLHLRKSKINNLCSAYQHAGIVHIFKYMRDDDVKEWKKLINPDHIDKATRYIRRLSLSLHLAFICTFMQTLSLEDAEEMQECIIGSTVLGSRWETDFNRFMQKGKTENATFALHFDMMSHCDEVCAISFAERLGGDEGYNLLLAAVKTSLPFAFLNGSSSYAAYCTKLLHEHFKCGPFYQKMKSTLFTTPYKGSNVNFALDAQRELDHQDVLKAFRSGATITSVIPRMSLIDTLNEVHELTIRNPSVYNESKQEDQLQEELLGLKISPTDIKYILRMTSLILRRGGISTETNQTVFNVYESSPEVLPESILDDSTKDIGTYLIEKFVAQNCLFGYTKSDVPSKADVDGPKELLQRLKQSKGVTLRRIPVKKKQTLKSERDIKEDKRKKQVAKETKQINHLSSDMNTCQAIVKPDCSKPKVQKASGIQKALMQLLVQFLTTGLDTTDDDLNDGKMTLENHNMVILSSPNMPLNMQRSVTFATLEFAGFKFSSYAHTGKEYLHHIEQNILKIKHQLSCLKHLVICEEKYKFTPDDFKAATRAQRKVTTSYSISHLKTSDEVLSDQKFDKPSLVSTAEGKSIASTYLAKNIETLDIKENIIIDIDSELHISTCSCHENTCTCFPFCTPIRGHFDAQYGFTRKELLNDIKQRKGEAEMSQVDWLIQCASSLSPGDACASIVSSGDIDAVILHLFAISHLWPRNEGGLFKNPVHVILKKPNHLYDIYNITTILELLEHKTSDKYIGIKVAVGLSLGGNDFLPKFYGISHGTKLNIFLKHEEIYNNLIHIITENNKILSVDFSSNTYKDFMKHVYCPKFLNSSSLTYEEVRQMSIQIPNRKKKEVIRNPQLWMPPEFVVEQLSKNVSCLIQYYLSAGNHSAQLPDFLTNGCLTKIKTGEIEYDFGEHAYISDLQSLLTIPREELLLKMTTSKKTVKRKLTTTPQKGRRRKVKPQASTPKKCSTQTETDDKVLS